jgi:hypothetical protein
VIVLVLATIVVGSLQGPVLEMSLSVDKSSYLPYEPVYARIVLRNTGNSPVAVPPLLDASASSILDFTIRTSAGQSVYGPFRVADLSWPEQLLRPGESATAVIDIAEEAGVKDPESKGSYCNCFMPDSYTVVAGWAPGYGPRDSSARSCTSETERFVVRHPRGEEVAALKLYRDLYNYSTQPYWCDGKYGLSSPDGGSRT